MARRQNNGGSRGGRQRQQRDTWEAQGVVEELNETRWGRKTLYNVTLDDGNVYGLGDKDYDLQEGDEVSLQVFENDKGYKTVEDGGVEILEGDTKPARGRSQSDRGRGNAREQDRVSKGSDRVSETDKKRRSKESIQYTEARAAAVAVLNFHVTEGLVNLGAKNKVALREAAYWGLLDQYTKMFYDETDELAALSRANEALSGGTDSPQDADEPSEDYDE